MIHEPNYICIDNDRLDKICRLRYGTEHDGNVEMVLNANSGLGALGPIYNGGLEIYLPDVTPKPSSTPTIRLWTK